MKLAETVLDVDSIEAIVEDELNENRSLMPVAANHVALLANSDKLGRWAATAMQMEFEPVPQKIVTVRKQRHGVRPVAELALRDRLAYRALIGRWHDLLPNPDRSKAAYDKFKEAPLSASPSYVVSSDITAYYQFIDHALLKRELEIQVRDADAISELVQLLQGICGGTTGIPQQNYASDVLAETYGDMLERSLLRSNLQVWRYNDDFRIACNSWSGALEAVDLLEARARNLGLALNDAKTVIRKADNYRKHIYKRDILMAEIAQNLGIDVAEMEIGPYQDFQDIPDEPNGDVAAYKEVLERWFSARRENKTSEANALLDLVPTALGHLSGEHTDTRTITLCMAFLRVEQHLTPQVCQYLEKIPGEFEKTFMDCFTDLLKTGTYLTNWQSLWLQSALARIADLISNDTAGAIRRDWIRKTFEDARGGEVVRASAALTLARHGAVDTPELFSLYDECSAVSRPVIASALGILDSDSRHRAIVGDDPLYQWCYEWSSRFR